MTESEENIILLLQKVASQLFPYDFQEEEYTRAILLDKIFLTNKELHSAIKDFILAHESLEFIASDYQLRLKAADIWNSQKQMFVEVLSTRTENLKQIAQQSNINIELEISKLTE
jgi:hypothetical protein